jgi:hypothetical protein
MITRPVAGVSRSRAEVIAAALFGLHQAVAGLFGGVLRIVPGGALLAVCADAAPVADQRPFAEQVGCELERVEAVQVARGGVLVQDETPAIPPKGLPG